MSRSIRSYLPEPGEDKRMNGIIFARVPASMKAKFMAISRQNDWTPSLVIRAWMEKFIDDEGPRQSEFADVSRRLALDETNKSAWK